MLAVDEVEVSWARVFQPMIAHPAFAGSNRIIRGIPMTQ